MKKLMNRMLQDDGGHSDTGTQYFLLYNNLLIKQKQHENR